MAVCNVFFPRNLGGIALLGGTSKQSTKVFSYESFPLSNIAFYLAVSTLMSMLVCLGLTEFVYLVDCVICHQCCLSACPALIYVCANHCSLSDLLISCCFASFACWSVYALIFCAFSGL